MKTQSPAFDFKEGRDYARARGRVLNTSTGTVGNLVEWMPGQYCKAFTGYGEWVGNYRPPLFETWKKADTVKESNDVQPTHYQPEQVKLPNKILIGKYMPRHIQIAFGRHIFRLLHGGRNCGLWLRDLPLNLHDLAREYGFRYAYDEYLHECIRTHQASQI